MSRPRGRARPLLAVLVVGLITLGGCGADSTASPPAGSMGSTTSERAMASPGSTASGSAASGSAASGSTASGSAAQPVTLPACPRVPRVPPRADGLPPLRLPCLGDGPAVRLSDLRGIPTVVNVWAAWCVNCSREMPLLAGAQQQAGGRLRLLGIHYKATRDQGLAAAQDFGVTFASVQDEDGDEVTRQLRVPGPPTTLFVDAKGRLTGRHIGEIRSADELADLVRRNLGVAL